MNEFSSLSKIFDTNVEFTPNKIDHNEKNACERRPILSNNEICAKYNNILVQDTPTPFMNRQLNLIKAKNQLLKSNNDCLSKKQIVPNTPNIRSLSTQNSSKKVKKLFDHNALLLEEEELPGEDNFSYNKNPNKASNLFKPKTILNNKENDSEDEQGCDLSFESLKKIERSRRNKLVARLSEIEKPNLKQNKANDNCDQNSFASSPILVKINTPVQNSYLNTSSASSLTHVTKHFDLSKSANKSEEEKHKNDENIDLTLFNSLKIDSTKKVKTGLVDKTNMSRSKSNNRLAKSKSNKNCKRSLSQKLVQENKRKAFNISYLELSENQIIKMKHMCDDLEEKNEIVDCFLYEKLRLNTTHFVLDFLTVFNHMNTDKKLLLLLIGLKRVKIIRYEWLVHSYKKDEWIEEDKYLIQSYVGKDLSEYDEKDFDIRLIKFIRNLELTSKTSLFSSYGNIYLLESYSEEQNDNLDSSLNDSCSSFKLSNYSKTNDYLYELITRCDGLITSRVACCDLIIVIDRTDDYDINKGQDAIKIKKEANYLKSSLNNIKILLEKKKRKNKSIKVLSSNWIMDCILENTKLDLDDYQITSI